MVESLLQKLNQADTNGVKNNHSENKHTTTPLPSSTTENNDNFIKKLRNFRVEFGPNNKDILHFTNQLSIMIRAGIGLPDALDLIASQHHNLKFASIIHDLQNQIESGQNFSQALSSYPKVFNNIYVNMVAAAEISGSLSGMLDKLAGYLDQETETRSQVKGAMVYPIIIATMAFSVTFFLLCFVLPKFASIFAGKEHLLPAPTKLLMGSSAFLRANWYLVLPSIAAVIAGFGFFIRTNFGTRWWDSTKLKLPIVKKLCRNLYITRSLHTMGVLTHAGVPILETISITAQVSGNTLYRQMWRTVESKVREGEKIASSLSTFSLMPPDVVQMIRSGEESGTFGEVLEEISNFYGRELKMTIKAVTSMIEPIMIVVMGIMVGFIAMSIMLPIFKMSNVVGSG